MNAINKNIIPAIWSLVKLGNVSEINSGIGFPKKYQGRQNEKYPFFKVGDISKNVSLGKRYLEIFEHSISENDLIEIKGKITEPNSIVFAKIGEALKLNRRGITKTACLVDNNVMSVKAIKSKLNYIYLYYFLLIQKFGELSRSTTVPSIRKSDVENIRIPLPPLPEQHRIVEKIEELFSELDNGIENLKKSKEQIKTYRQAVLKFAFEGKLVQGERTKDKGKSENGELPDGWEWVTINSVGEIVTGTTPSKKQKEYYGEGYPLYKPTDLNAGINVNCANDNLTELGIKKARLLPVGSVMVTCIGATIGKTGLAQKEGATNQQINSIIPKSNFNSKFVYYFCISEHLQKQILDNASSTTLPILNKSRFERLLFPLTNIETQTQIVEEVERRFSVADKMETAIDESLKKAGSLRQSILKKAFEGKLVC